MKRAAILFGLLALCAVGAASAHHGQTSTKVYVGTVPLGGIDCDDNPQVGAVCFSVHESGIERIDISIDDATGFAMPGFAVVQYGNGSQDQFRFCGETHASVDAGKVVDSVTVLVELLSDRDCGPLTPPAGTAGLVTVSY